MDCCYDQEYERLIIKGNPPKEKINAAWEKIYLEYTQILNDGGGNDLFDKTVEINTIVAKIALVDKILRHFRVSINESLLKILKYYGVDCGIKIDDEPNVRFKKMEAVVARVKLWFTQLDLARVAFEELQKTHTSERGGRERFEEQLLELSTYRKYAIREDDINVRQFVKAIKKMEQEYIRLASKM